MEGRRKSQLRMGGNISWSWEAVHDIYMLRGRCGHMLKGERGCAVYVDGRWVERMLSLPGETGCQVVGTPSSTTSEVRRQLSLELAVAGGLVAFVTRHGV